MPAAELIAMDPAAVLRKLHLRRVSCTSSVGSDSPLPSGSSDHASGHGVATLATKTPSLQDLKYNEQRTGYVADSVVNRHHSATSLPSYSLSSLQGTQHSPLHSAAANSFHAAPTHPCCQSESQVLVPARAAGFPAAEDAAARPGTDASKAGPFASAAQAAILPEYTSAGLTCDSTASSCGGKETQEPVTLSPVSSAGLAFPGGTVSAPTLGPLEEAESPMLQEQRSRGSGVADAGAWAGRSGSPSRWVLPEAAEGRSRRRSLELHISRLRRSSIDAGSSCAAGPAHSRTPAPASHSGVGISLGDSAGSEGGSEVGLPLGDTPTAAQAYRRRSATGFGALGFAGSHSGSGGAGRCRDVSGGGTRPTASVAVPSQLAAAGVGYHVAHAVGDAVGELLQEQPHAGAAGGGEEVATLRAERGRLLCELQAAHAREMALAEQLGRARAEALELRQQLAQQRRAAEAGLREEAQRSKADALSEARRWRSKAAAAEEQLQTARAQLACLRAAAATESAAGTGAHAWAEPPLASLASAGEAGASLSAPGPVGEGAAPGVAEAAAAAFAAVPGQARSGAARLPGWAAHLTARVAVGGAGSGGSSPWLGADTGSSGVDSPLLVSRTPSYGTPRHPAAVSAAGLAAAAGVPQTGAGDTADAVTGLAPAPGAGNGTRAPGDRVTAEAPGSSGGEAAPAWGRAPFSAHGPAPTVNCGPGPGAAGDLRRSASDLCLHAGEAPPHNTVAEAGAQAATAPTAAPGHHGTAATGTSCQHAFAAASSPSFVSWSAAAAASAGTRRVSEVSPFNAEGPGAEAAVSGGRRLAPAAAFSSHRPSQGTLLDPDSSSDSSTHRSRAGHNCPSPLPSSRSVPDTKRPAPGPQRTTSPTPAPPRPTAARISLSAAVAAAVSAGSPSRPASAGGGPPGCTPPSSASTSAPPSSAPSPSPSSYAPRPTGSRHLGPAPPPSLLCDATDTAPAAARGTRAAPSDAWPSQPPLYSATAPSSGDGWPDGWSADLAVVAAAAAVSNGLHSGRRPPLAAPGRPCSPPAPTTGPVHAHAPECSELLDAGRCNGGGGSSSFGPGGSGSPRAAARGAGRGAMPGVMRRSAPGTAASLGGLAMGASGGGADVGWGGEHGGDGACGGGGSSTVHPAPAIPQRVSVSGLVRYDSDGVVVAAPSGSAVGGEGRAVNGGGAVGAEQGHQGQDLGSTRQGGACALQGHDLPDFTTSLLLNEMGHGRGSAVGPQGGGAGGERDAVERLRQAGNRAYSCGQHSLAGHCYTTALELLLGRSHSSGAAGAAAAAAAQCGAGGVGVQAGAAAADPRVVAVLYCNRAAALLAAGSYIDAVADCCAASAYDGQYARAWQRRSEALVALGAFAAAAAALQRCVELVEAAEAELQLAPGGAAAPCTAPSSGRDDAAASAASRLSALRARIADLRKLSHHASGADAGAGLSAAGRLAAALATGSAAVAAAAGPVVDYYAVLRLPGPEADAADVRKAYRRLALQYHPDKAAAAGGEAAAMAAEQGSAADAGSGGTAAARAAAAAAAVVFPLVAEAYGVLSNPSSRRLYDIRRARGLGSRGRGVGPGSAPGVGRPPLS